MWKIRLLSKLLRHWNANVNDDKDIPLSFLFFFFTCMNVFCSLQKQCYRIGEAIIIILIIIECVRLQCDSTQLNIVGKPLHFYWILYRLFEMVVNCKYTEKKHNIFMTEKDTIESILYATCFQWTNIITERERHTINSRPQQSNRINIMLNIYVACFLTEFRGHRHLVGNSWNKSYTHKLAVNYFMNIEERGRE